MSDLRDLFPPPDQLADSRDQLDWNRQRDGRMRDFAADDDTVQTEPFDPSAPQDAVG